MSELFEKSIRTLELPAVLEMLSARAVSEAAREKSRHIMPATDRQEVLRLLDETDAARERLGLYGSPSFSGVKDVSEPLARADRGGMLNTRELLNIAGLLTAARRVYEYDAERKGEATAIDRFFSALHTNKYLEDRIHGAILDEETIADTASAELLDIRRKMRIAASKGRQILQKIISSPSYAKVLQETLITQRDGRFVVPVKAECKGSLPGLVHDISSSGATLFVEPMGVVQANNELKELEAREEKEIERILRELSAQCADAMEYILLDYDMLVHLDMIFARAQLSYTMNASRPEVVRKGAISLKRARHPLLDQAKAVPVTVELGGDYDTLVITGPNTGGKTVTLKTLGLLCLMAQCGLHIPADSGSTVRVFDRILADVGDEQSIEQSLSTFSAHMSNTVDILRQADDDTLILFDELGAGTDPAEGAALATAIIEFCRKLGSRVVATTHYAELKLYAMRTKGVINASCEFDVETLRPTYKLLIGIPGKSNAFAISRKLGLSEEILKEADDLVDKSDKDFEDVLSQLEQQRQQMELARQEAERLKQETAKIKQQNEEYQEQLRKEKEKAVESARREAQHIIDEARAAANIASEELKAMRKQLADSADVSGINQRQAELRRNLNEVEDKLRASQPKKERPKPTRGILVGDTVELLKLGTKASVLAINKDGTYQLQAGILKLTAKPDEIYLLENENPYKAKGGHPAHSGREMKMTAMPTEVDLRGMDTVEAICVLERYLDEAMRANLSTVRIIHGKGTGALRAAVQQSLKKNKFIKSFRLGVYGEGEDGVTIAEFR